MEVIAILLVCAAALPWVIPDLRPRSGVALRAQLRRRVRRRTPRRDEAAVIGAALTSVAARLRAGQEPSAAWRDVREGLPEPIAGALQAIGAGEANPRGASGAAGVAIAAASAATRLARDLGAELAPVLDATAEGIEESTRAHAERRAALAGPRATARVLLGLPLLGIGLGTAMGAGPVRLFTSSVWGMALLALAAVLVILGRWWIERLFTRAGDPEEGTGAWVSS